jgi:acyl-CoA thioesterase I
VLTWVGQSHSCASSVVPNTANSHDTKRLDTSYALASPFGKSRGGIGAGRLAVNENRASRAAALRQHYFRPLRVNTKGTIMNVGSTTLPPAHTLVCIGDRLATVPQPGKPGDNWGTFLHALLVAAHPGRRLQYVDQCAFGQRLHHLRERWADDVLWYRPDTVVVMCGVSDAYHSCVPTNPEIMPPREWGDCLRRLIRMHREALPGSRLVFIEPFLHTLGYIREAESLKEYQRQLRVVCDETGCPRVQLAERMQARLTAEGEWALGTSLDPSVEAGLLIADAALEVLAPEAPRACPPCDDDLVLCIGDSITDVGRRDAQWAPLGAGYVRYAKALWQARSGAVQRVRNEGIGGNTILDLKGRWERDAVAHRPKRLTMKIGINDVNRTLSNHPTPVPADLFERTLDELLARMRDVRPDCRIHLIQPFYLSRMQDPQSYRTRVLQALAQYHEGVRRIAAKYECPVLETHEMFQRHLQVYHQCELANEPVHINLMGHTILAEEFLKLLARTA